MPASSQKAKRFLARLKSENARKAQEARANARCCQLLQCWVTPVLCIVAVAALVLRSLVVERSNEGAASDLGLIPMAPVFNAIKEPYVVVRRKNNKMMEIKTNADPNVALRYRRTARIAVCITGNEVRPRR